MKRSPILYAASVVAFVSINCSQGGPATGPGPSAGAPPSTQAGSGSAGAPALAGSGPTGTAGAPTTTSGGAGGSDNGLAGAPALAGAAGAPVVAGGSGGTPGAAGAGTAGAGTAGGGGGGLSAEVIVPGLNGFYWEGTCGGTIAVTGNNCPLSGTQTSCDLSVGINREKTVPVMGTAGQLYTINIEVRGVIGTRCYKGGKRASSAAPSSDGYNNWWYIGGTYVNPTGWWNSYELHVSPSTGDASGDVYYFNGSDVEGGDACEKESTYLVKYDASFKAKGGGSLKFKLHDQNCSGLQNCGPNNFPATCAPRTVDLAGMGAALPAGIAQPPSNMQWKPQWLLIAVKSITSP